MMMLNLQTKEESISDVFLVIWLYLEDKTVLTIALLLLLMDDTYFLL